MTHSEFNAFLSGISALSPEQLRQLRLALDSEIAQMPAMPTDLTAAEKKDLELQIQLYKRGLLSEIKPPIRDMSPYRNRRLMETEGEPLSETVIRDRDRENR